MGVLQRLKEFSKNTQMHGVKYIFQDDVYWIEKFIWVIMFISSVAIAGYYGKGLLDLFHFNPFIVSVYRANAPISEHNFPAVTLCNAEQYSEKKFNDILNNLGHTFRNMIQYTLGGLNHSKKRANSNTFKELIGKFNLSEENLLYILQKSSQSCADLLQLCSWKHKQFQCSQFAQEILTDAGYCCTLNSQLLLNRRSYIEPGDPTIIVEPSQNSNLEFLKPAKRRTSNKWDNNFTSVQDAKFFLEKTEAGQSNGLTLILKVPIVSKQVFNRPFVGFRILIHSGDNFPRMTHSAFPVGAGRVSHVGISVTSVFTTDDALLYSPQHRGCYISSEKKFQWTNVYSMNNCLVDCQINIALQMCACVPYTFAEITPYRICYPHEYSCLFNDNHSTSTEFLSPSCPDCRSSCNRTHYRADVISEFRLPDRVDDVALFKASKINPPIQSNDYAVIHIYYSTHSSVIYKRDVKYGWEDLLSAMGGLLSVGFGMSLINAVEVVYFATLRWMSG